MEPTHIVSLGGETRRVHSDNLFAACDELIKKYGGSPEVKPLLITKPVVVATPVPAALSQAPVGEHGINEAGKERSLSTRFELQANGFSPKVPVYAVGSRVNELGVRNAQSSREEYDKLPRVSESCAQLIQTVASERRQDLAIDQLSSLRMTPAGKLRRRSDLVLSERAFGGLITRVGLGKGGSYLRDCPPELRAVNVNHWLEQLQQRELEEEAQAKRLGDDSWKPRDAKLRTRINGDEREIFALVSGSYGSFDVDKIAQALSMASPSDARGSIVYDGHQAKFETLFHSNIAPQEYVAGEFFKAGVLVRSADDGSGSIRVSAVVWQNLCLNLIILDECVQEIASIRHIGSVEKLANRFRDAFKTALGSIDHFQEKWGYALNDDVTAIEGRRADWALDGFRRITVSEFLPGLFNGIIERELVPVRGERKQAVKELVRMYGKDESAAVRDKDFLSRAAIVNAFTRYAHEVNESPFEQEEIERAAGGLLNIKRSNKALPFEPIDF